MNEGNCSIPGCDSPAHARTWCWKHYGRWQKYGDPTYEAPRVPRQVRAKVPEPDPIPAPEPIVYDRVEVRSGRSYLYANDKVIAIVDGKPPKLISDLIVADREDWNDHE